MLLSSSLFQPDSACSAQQSEKEGWDNLSAIMEKIVPPKFANHDYSIVELWRYCRWKN